MKTILKFKVGSPFDVDEEIRKYFNLLQEENINKKAPKDAIYKYVYFLNTGWGKGYDDEKIKTIIFSMIALTRFDFIGKVFNEISYENLTKEKFQLEISKWLIANGNNPTLSESSQQIREKFGIEHDIRNFITGEWVNMLQVGVTKVYPVDILNPQWIRFE